MVVYYTVAERQSRRYFFRSQTRKLRIRPDQDTTWREQLVAAVRQPLRLELPAGEKGATIVVRNARGEIVYEDEFELEGEGPFVDRRPNLARGWYDVEAHTPSGNRYRGRFEVPNLLPTRDPIRFRLEKIE